MENDCCDLNFYNSDTKENTNIFFKLYIVIPDQPERRSINRLLSNGHGYHDRFGWSFDIKNIEQKMISCSDCIIYIKNKLKTQNVTIKVCPNCYNFWKNPDIIYNEPEKDFSDQNKQQCIQLTYTILKQTLILIHNFIVNNK